jgi:amidase
VTVDLERATAAELVADLRAGAVSSRELLDAQLAQVDRWNPTVNAVVATDLDAARRAAQEIDDGRARGAAVGPLAGLPMTVKDSFETRGLVTTSGAPELREHVPEADADAVARLREAGAIVFGKTNLPMYAGDWQTYNDVYGLTRNPWDVTRGAGGSSGGSAVAVATGMSPLELGSDIGGSIRVPAHFCGVFGHKPTQGAVPDRGHVPGPPGTMAPPDLGVTGPLGRSVADLELAMDALLACGLRDGPVPFRPRHRAPARCPVSRCTSTTRCAHRAARCARSSNARWRRSRPPERTSSR